MRIVSELVFYYHKRRNTFDFLPKATVFHIQPDVEHQSFW